jgi:hypothetical protein
METTNVKTSPAKAKFLRKKNEVRKAIVEKGAVKKEGKNLFDNYKYITEAQYKALINEVISKIGLEFSSGVDEVMSLNGSEKQPNARLVKMHFTLADVETGYSETESAFGEALDKGDKAIYKAYTGALKYFIANNFLIEGGDEAEKESPTGRVVERNVAPNQALNRLENRTSAGPVPTCNMCGEPMTLKKDGTGYYCKHADGTWGKPVYEPNMTEAERRFEDALEQSLKKPSRAGKDAKMGQYGMMA